MKVFDYKICINKTLQGLFGWTVVVFHKDTLFADFHVNGQIYLTSEEAAKKDCQRVIKLLKLTK